MANVLRLICSLRLRIAVSSGLGKIGFRMPKGFGEIRNINYRMSITLERNSLRQSPDRRLNRRPDLPLLIGVRTAIEVRKLRQLQLPFRPHGQFNLESVRKAQPLFRLRHSLAKRISWINSDHHAPRHIRKGHQVASFTIFTQRGDVAWPGVGI